MLRFKMLLAAAAASTLAAAALPAGAQSFHFGWNDGPPPPPSFQPAFDRSPPPGVDLRGREDRLGGWIGASAREGRIDGWQARRMFDDLRSVRDEERSIRDRQYGRLYPHQAWRLNGRLERISDRLRGAPHPAWRW